MKELTTLTITPSDIFEVFTYGGYIDQLEKNLKGCPELDSWERYQKNPEPFLVDLILDFGNEFPPIVVETGQYIRYAAIVARNYNKGYVTKWTPELIEEG